MLQGMTIASPPALRISAAASSQAGFLRDDTTTLAPCRARCRAIDLPMPLLEPVTTATLPVRSKSGDAIEFPPEATRPVSHETRRGENRIVFASRHEIAGQRLDRARQK